MAESAAGLIALSGGSGDAVAEALLAGNRGGAEALLDRWLWVFGDRYSLELIRTGREQEGELIEQSVDLATARGVPVVATNDVRFLARDDFEAHEARVCIHEGRTLDDPRRPRTCRNPICPAISSAASTRWINIKPWIMARVDVCWAA